MRRVPERTAPVAVALPKAADVDLKSSPSSSIDLDSAMLAKRVAVSTSSSVAQKSASDYRGVDPGSI